jgi:16S rRNA (guanine527-N7)-methyltransferase
MNVEVQLEAYERIVRDYAKVLDLSSPKLIEHFQVGIRKSLPFAEVLESGSKVLDIGSGAGLPAIPIAILRPDLEITLCEIRTKRAAFLDRAISRLDLRHVTVYNGDVQKISGRFDAVTALWVGSLEKLFSLCQHALEPKWRIVTRKGAELSSELERLRAVTTIEMFHVKHLEDGANLVTIEGVL